MKQKFYTLLLSALALLVFTGNALAETVNHTLFFRNGTLRTTNSDTGTEYTGNVGKWSVSENTLTLDGFEFITSADIALQVVSTDAKLILTDGSVNTLESTLIGKGNFGIYVERGNLTITGKGRLNVTVPASIRPTAVYLSGNLSVQGATLVTKAGEDGSYESDVANRCAGVWATDIEIKDGGTLKAISGGSGIYMSGTLELASTCSVFSQGKIGAIYATNLPTPESFIYFASTAYDGDEAKTGEMNQGLGTYMIRDETVKYLQINPNIEDGLKPGVESYLVNSQAGLAVLAEIVAGAGDYEEEANSLADYTFTMMSDIELKDGEPGMDGETGWMSIGIDKKPFKGTFDGNGHKITGLWINKPEVNQVGFFGGVNNAVIKNLGVETTTAGIIGGEFVGGLIGATYQTSVSNCYASGTIEAKGDYAGALIGDTNGGVIINSYAYGSVTAGSAAGGLVGGMEETTISNSYAACEVVATFGAGGLVGGCNGGSSIESCVVASPSVAAPNFANRVIGVGEEVTLSNNYAWVGNIPDGTDETFVHDGMNGANWSGEMPESWTEDLWLIDPTGVLMPKLAIFGDNQPDVLNPKYQPETPGTGATYTINLEVADGIDIAGLTAGNHTVAEGDHLFLQFLPEDRTLGAEDILFLIDGIETAFTASDAGNYFSYILNPVDADHTILIALKEYPVTLPEVEGIIYNVGAGTHLVPYGEKFTFSLTLADGIDPEKVHVFANGIEVKANELRSTVLTYTIDKVITSIVVVIEGAGGTTGNIDIAFGKINIAIDNGQLTIDNGTANAIDAAVYTVTGQTFVQLRGLRGSKSVTLPAGIYLVKAGKQTWKVMINDSFE
ncbi:GLUG motif-containing protein [Parabacteroides sp. PF5-6]|uniref:GLUG motif-containing protein n=1 Tax=Parabacteroides sp. PF5-6 TaxID=1742403 RepID=UPI0024067560|nr:GLUG motif-containing protein [Parabacteroides sp. PF5-6]MDF9828695.1 hypothetical protein [Parabacteroides sp. PF5-6]